MRTLALVALSLRGRLGRYGRCTGGVRFPHLRMMGVWRERPLVGILRGDTHLAVERPPAEPGAYWNGGGPTCAG